MEADRILELDVIIAASPEEAWEAWTTAAGIASFFAPQCKLELKIGGAYEMYFLLDNPEGTRGGEGCTITGYEAARWLAFTWNFPPHLDMIRNCYTNVRLEFEQLAVGQTRVSLCQTGWQDGPQWDEGYDYFSKAWRYVLNNLKANFEPPESAAE